MFLSLVLHKFPYFFSLAAIPDKTIKYSLFVQVEHFQRRRLLWVFQHAAYFVEAVQIVPLREELLKFEAIV